jgi:pyruvate dehydrogenase E1 component alpha subunit
MHIADLSKGMLGANGIVGGGPPLICGAALAAKTNKTGGRRHRLRWRRRFQPGHERSNPTTWRRSGNLPAIFIVEDNGYAESTASEMVGRRQPGRARNGFGIAVHRGRRLDFFAVYEAAREVDRARPAPAADRP